MSSGVVRLQITDTVADAIEVFKENYSHALPIVEGEKLKGIITPIDIMNFIVPEFSK